MTGSQVMTVGVTTTMTMGRILFLARKVTVLDPSLLSSSIYPPASPSFSDHLLSSMPSHYLSHSLFGSIPLHCFFFGQFGRRLILIYFFLSHNNCTYTCTHTSTVFGPSASHFLGLCTSTLVSSTFQSPRLAVTSTLGVGHDRWKQSQATAGNLLHREPQGQRARSDAT